MFLIFDLIWLTWLVTEIRTSMSEPFQVFWKPKTIEEIVLSHEEFNLTEV